MSTVVPVSDLPAAWRARATLLRRHGAEEAVATTAALADELESAIQAAGGGLLTLSEAAAESGYSIDHIGRLVRAGAVPNRGRPNAPRVRRSDLPRKTGTSMADLTGARPLDISKAQIARALIDPPHQDDR
jgi:hypothetical protein